MLAGSIVPARVDLDLITRLSDLSGPASSELKDYGYLTGYCLPGSDNYALAKTWPDRLAKRAGCVLTHTLLIPGEVWRNLKNPRDFEKLFRKPVSNESASPYTTVLAIEQGSSPPPREYKSRYSPEFVGKYFGEGIHPLVWFSETGPEELVWRILGALWPAMRSRFSFCTMSLQPRTLEDRGMDLQFAPAWSYPRFQKYSREQIIGAEARSRIYNFSDLEPWCRKWHDAIFSPETGTITLAAYQEILASLDAEPTAVRRLFLLEELQERLSQSPMAAVGSLDVLESLAPEASDCAVLKNEFVDRAIETAESNLPSAESYDSLRLIKDRLLKPAYGETSDRIFSHLKEATATAVGADLSQSLSLIGSLIVQDSQPSKGTMLLIEGFLEGLSKVVNVAPVKLSAIRDFGFIAPFLISHCRGLSGGYLLAAGADSRMRDTASRELMGWLNQVRGTEEKKEIRKSLFPFVLNSDFLPLFSDLVSGLDRDEAREILELVGSHQEALSDERIVRVLKDGISVHFQDDLRAWAKSLKTWSSAIAELVAATFPHAPAGFDELLQEDRWKAQQKTQILTCYLASWQVQWFPEWLYSTAKDSNAFWDQLLAMGSDSTPVVDREISRFLPGVHTAPGLLLSRHESALEAFEGKNFYSQLTDIAMRTAGWQFVVAAIEKDELARWNSFSPAWYGNANQRELESVIAQYHRSPNGSPAGAWDWLILAPDSLYRRPPYVLVTLIDGIILTTHGVWTPESTCQWLKVLQRSNRLGNFDLRIKLCIQALRYCFANRPFPLGPIVAEVFNEVHVVATDKHSTVDTSSLFGFFDHWDKGKQLRRDLIDGFMGSGWSPADLAAAPKDDVLLRKIVKRLLRNYGGDRYLERIRNDLSNSESKTHRTAKVQLDRVLNDLDYQDDWD